MSNNHIENNAARDVAAHKYIIFSVDGPDRVSTVRALRRYGVGFKIIHGCYKGKRELSFIVNAAVWSEVWRAVEWAIQKQESILHLGPIERRKDARPVVLEYVETTRPPEFLGYWYAVSRETALQCDAWTRDDGQYYVAALTRPDHIPGPGEAWKEAIAASHATVRTSNRNAVRKIDAGHFTPDGKARTHSGHVEERRVRTRRSEVAGHFTADGKARTPSGHEF